MSKKTEMTGAERKAALLVVGAKLAAKHGAVNVTRRMVAEGAKCSEALVSAYFGTITDAQRAFARKAKSLGLKQPDKAKVDAIGVKLRAHGPRDKRDTRKRSAKEVEAIKRKNLAAVEKKSVRRASAVSRGGARNTFADLKGKVSAAVKKSVAKRAAASSAGSRETKPEPAKREVKPVVIPRKPGIPGPASTPARTVPEVKSAARAPKAPPPAAVELPDALTNSI